MCIVIEPSQYGLYGRCQCLRQGTRKSKRNKRVSLISNYKYFYRYGGTGFWPTRDLEPNFPLQADCGCLCHEPDRSKGQFSSLRMNSLYLGGRTLAWQVSLSQAVPCFGSWHSLRLFPTGSLGTVTCVLESKRLTM